MCAVTRLSQIETVRLSHFTRTWQSAEWAMCCFCIVVRYRLSRRLNVVLTVKRSFKIASDSSSFKPMMRLVKPGWTNKAFCPVTYDVLVSGGAPGNKSSDD